MRRCFRCVRARGICAKEPHTCGPQYGDPAVHTWEAGNEAGRGVHTGSGARVWLGQADAWLPQASVTNPFSLHPTTATWQRWNNRTPSSAQQQAALCAWVPIVAHPACRYVRLRSCAAVRNARFAAARESGGAHTISYYIARRQQHTTSFPAPQCHATRTRLLLTPGERALCAAGGAHRGWWRANNPRRRRSARVRE